MGSLDVQSDRVDPLVGSMLGKDYRVIEPIGFGGMAVVYIVEHQTLRKRFAAKVLSVELAANHEARARFTQEAHAASQLDHENIVNISDFGATADQRPFFVMELLRGQTLDQRIAESAMSIEEVVAVAVPVARALAHAHAEGIIHRDVKPENVFLVQRSQGRFGVKVVDFGIAKTPLNTRLTKMGETMGSPMFMAPEACRGEDVDHRADLYSFGVLLYLMLCGRVPFEDENLLKVLRMQVYDPLPPPRSINPELSPALAQVIERALAKDPEARYASMTALLTELEAAVPPGSDRLLIEAQSGGASSFRLALAGQPSGRSTSSQSLARVASQPQLHVSQPLPAGGSLDPLPALGAALRRRPRPWWLVALPVLGVATYGAWRAVSHGPTPPAQLAPAAADEPPAPGSAAPGRDPSAAAAPPAPADAAASGSADPAPAAPVVPETVHLHVATTPAGAIVELDGKRLGITPLDADLPRATGDAQLVVSHDGFADVRRRVDLRADRSIAVALPLAARPVRPVKRPAPPPPAAPAAAPAEPRDAGPELDIRMSR